MRWAYFGRNRLYRSHCLIDENTAYILRPFRCYRFEPTRIAPAAIVTPAVSTQRRIQLFATLSGSIRTYGGRSTALFALDPANLRRGRRAERVARREVPSANRGFNARRIHVRTNEWSVAVVDQKSFSAFWFLHTRAPSTFTTGQRLPPVNRVYRARYVSYIRTLIYTYT